MRRRNFLASKAALAVTAIGGSLFFRAGAHAKDETFPVTRTEEEWRKLLTPD